MKLRNVGSENRFIKGITGKVINGIEIIIIKENSWENIIRCVGKTLQNNLPIQSSHHTGIEKMR